MKTNTVCCIGSVKCSKCRSATSTSSKRLTPEQEIAALTREVERLERAIRNEEAIHRALEEFIKPLAEQVESEVAQHPGVVAVVNEVTGRVATFLEPVPYFVRHDSSPSSDLGRLRAELSEALAKLNQAEARFAPATELLRLEQTVKSLRDELYAAEQPRRDERRSQRYGGDLDRGGK